MSLGFLDSLAVWFRVRPRITPDINGLFLCCDISERAVRLMRFCAWAVLVTQLLLVLLSSPSVITNVLAVMVVFASIIVMRGIVWANATVRSTIMLARTLQSIVDAQYTTIEEQRNTIEEQTRIIRRLSGDAE